MLARSLATVSFILSLAVSVSAGLYGTSPEANTVWTAGRSQKVTWTDDKSSPHLSKLGPIDIELYTGDDTKIATLAANVDPASKSQTVWISPGWTHNGSDYYVRFYSKSPPISVYTAFFTILDMSSIEALRKGTPDNHTTPGADGLYTPYLTLVLPNSTSVSALLPVRTSAKLSPTGPPVSKEDEDAYLHTHDGDHITSGADRAIDFERLKFRLVFILWPALVGITMAL